MYMYTYMCVYVKTQESSYYYPISQTRKQIRDHKKLKVLR